MVSKRRSKVSKKPMFYQTPEQNIKIKSKMQAKPINHPGKFFLSVYTLFFKLYYFNFLTPGVTNTKVSQSYLSKTFEKNLG